MNLENFKLNQEEVYQVPNFMASTTEVLISNKPQKSELDYFLLLKKFFTDPSVSQDEVSTALMIKEAKDFFTLFLKFFDDLKQFLPQKRQISKDSPDNETTLRFSTHGCDCLLESRYDVVYDQIFANLQKLKDPKTLVIDKQTLTQFNNLVVSVLPNTCFLTKENTTTANQVYVSYFSRHNMESALKDLPHKSFDFININGNCSLTKMLDLLFVGLNSLDLRGQLIISNVYDPHNIWNCFAHMLRSTSAFKVDIFEDKTSLILIEKVGTLYF